MPASEPPRRNRPEFVPALIPPLITAAAIAGMIGVARIYDSLPLKAPACGLRSATGLPCIACGGTRSMMALAHGDISGALRFNPLIFLGVIAAVLWLLISLVRYRFFPASFESMRPRRLPLWTIVTALVALFVANWIYLYLYLPE